MNETTKRMIELFKGADISEWSCCKHHLTHKPTGLTLWIANGSFGLHVEQMGTSDASSTHFDIPAWDKRKLWRAVNGLRNRMALAAMEKAMEPTQ